MEFNIHVSSSKNNTGTLRNTWLSFRLQKKKKNKKKNENKNKTEKKNH